MIIELELRFERELKVDGGDTDSLQYRGEAVGAL